MKKIFTNIMYSMMSNGFNVMISVLIVLVLPKYVSQADYGLWQLFLFYFSYIGFLHFGWEDGIYLRYAGLSYTALDKSMILGQSALILFVQCFWAVMIFSVAGYGFLDSTYEYIFHMLAIALILANGNNLFSLIFQMTSRISDYARVTALEPFLFFSLIISCMIYGWCNAEAMIGCKIFSLLVVFSISLYILSDMRHAKFPAITDALSEAKANISSGSKLMLANIANMLVIGVVRFGISQGWDLITFGKVSLTLSISNFLLVFINAVSIVLLPALRRITESRRQVLYGYIREILTSGMIAMLVIYYPLSIFLQIWLPSYSDSFRYMAILFPVCITESRMSLLINTYLKAMRKEKLMLRINILSVVFSTIITFVCVALLHDLLACIFSIVVIFAFKAYWAEWNLCRILQRKIWYNILTEIAMIFMFIVCAWYIGGLQGLFLYFLTLLIYMFFGRNRLIYAYKQLAYIKGR